MISPNHEKLNRAAIIVSGFDFGYVVDRAIKAGMPEDEAPAALSELKEFLLQCAALPDTDLAPQSQRCDDLWHEFIVSDTRAYFRFCEAVYGHYLHHDGVTLSAETLEKARQNSIHVFGPAQTDDVVACGEVTDSAEVFTAHAAHAA